MSIASIMLATYNRLELTKQTINNLINNTGYKYRLIIVDNNSTDGTIEYLNTLKIEDNLCIDLEIQFNSKNFGVATGRNQALLIADKYNDTWLATIDNDVILPKNWLKESIEILELNKDFGMIGVNMEDVHYPIINQNNKEFQIKKTGNLGTAAAVFNRSVHNQIGFFCLDYGSYGEEDSDAGYRIRQLGHKLGYIKEMGVHLGTPEADTEEYRTFKNKCRENNIKKFRENCNKYARDPKSIYIPFSI